MTFVLVVFEAQRGVFVIGIYDSKGGSVVCNCTKSAPKKKQAQTIIS